MKQYKVKAYYKTLLRMQTVVTGKRTAEAVKRVYIKDYGFNAADIDIIKL